MHKELRMALGRSGRFPGKRSVLRESSLSLLFLICLSLNVGQEKLNMSSMTSENHESFYRYEYSYIDRSGRVVIDASAYEGARSFSNGLAAVLVKNRGWGFIEKTGSLVIPPRFRKALSFSEGFAGVDLDGKWGFIDTRGVIVIQPQYGMVHGFSEGVAVVVKGDEILVIDKHNDIVSSDSIHNSRHIQIFEDAQFTEGLIPIYDSTKALYGFADKTGVIIIEPSFAEVSRFSEGIARASVVVNAVEKVGFIDHQGRFVIQPLFNTDGDFRSNSTDFSESLASLTEGLNPTVTEEEKFVYISKQGAIVMRTPFFRAGMFKEGLASVHDVETRKSGFIDRSGKVIISLKYDMACDFSEGVACVGRLSK